MDRRRILLVVAVLVAALGATLVFLYTKGADTRAEEKFEDAQATGKLALQAVSKDSLLDGYQTTTDSLSGTVALSTIYPGEQIISVKWGTSAAPQSNLQIPDTNMAISVNLTDPARVAGFVSPGSQVAIFLTGHQQSDQGAADAGFARLLLERVTVLGVGSTTPVSTTTTDETGQSTTEQLPRTLMTLSVDQHDAEKILYAQSTGELAFGLLTDKSAVAPGPPMTFANLFE
jgi:pilus assembly protein CpaB